MKFPKGRTRAQEKDAKDRAFAAAVHVIRVAVFDRDRHRCRCCREFFHRTRPAESMHEIVPRSLGGVPSLENSIAVCGSGTTGCHGALQANQIQCEPLTPAGARGRLRFQPKPPKRPPPNG